nr:hypothetical protein [Tanacetum cinerariifolium]
MKIDQHHHNTESDLIESMLNRDSSIISSSSKIDSLLDEFASELTHLKSIPPGIDETDCHPENEIRPTKRLLIVNSSPRPPKEFVSENSNADIESFSPSPIPVEDSDSFMEEIDLSFTPDDPKLPGIEEDDYDSERDIIILEELLENYSLSLPESESFCFDITSLSRPPSKPPDGNTGILNIKMMGDISEQKELVEYINTPSWNRPAFSNYDDDDDEDYTIAITPEEPDNSLSIGDEHLDTISATESNEVIKSSVEDLVPILSESEGIPDNMCDVPFHDNSPPLDVSKDQFEDFSNSNNNSTSIDDDYFSIDNIDYTFSDHTEETCSGSTTTHVDYSLPKYDLFIFKIEPDQGELTSVVMEDNLGEPRVHVSNVWPTHPTLMLDSDFIPSNNSLPKSELFYFDIEEKNSGSTTIHADISLSNLECFYFKSEPDPGKLISIVDSGIRENVPSTTNVNLSLEDGQSPLFTYVVWIFLSFLTYLVVPPYILSSGNEDTIFDPDISNYYFSSLEQGVSHRSGTFMKFSVYRNHLNESPMQILSSTCSPIDQ